VNYPDNISFILDEVLETHLKRSGKVVFRANVKQMLTDDALALTSD
jgi:hypothetical protein